MAAPATVPWYDVGRDGRFLMVRWSEEERSSRAINLVLDWPALVGQEKNTP